MGSLQQYHRTLVNAGEGNIEDGGMCKRGRSTSCHATSLTYTWIYTLSTDLRGFFNFRHLLPQCSALSSHQEHLTSPHKPMDDQGKWYWLSVQQRARSIPVFVQSDMMSHLFYSLENVLPL